MKKQVLVPFRMTIGGVTFYMRNGKQIARKSSSTKRKVSKAMKTQNSRVRSVVSFYKMLPVMERKEWLPSVEKGNAYAEFMSLNLRNVKWELSVVQYAQSFRLLAPYIISCGKLAPIQYEIVGSLLVTDLTCSRTSINTRAELSKELLADSRFRFGDNLYFVLIKQYLMHGNTAPRIEVFTQLMPVNMADLSSVDVVVYDGHIAFRLPDNGIYGAAVIHTRPLQHQASQQQIVMNDMSVLEQYTVKHDNK